MLDDSDVACLAIDETHCISQWGHTIFDQNYRQFGFWVRERFKNAVCVALNSHCNTTSSKGHQRHYSTIDEGNRVH